MPGRICATLALDAAHPPRRRGLIMKCKAAVVHGVGQEWSVEEIASTEAEVSWPGSEPHCARVVVGPRVRQRIVTPSGRPFCR